MDLHPVKLGGKGVINRLAGMSPFAELFDPVLLLGPYKDKASVGLRYVESPDDGLRSLDQPP